MKILCEVRLNVTQFDRSQFLWLKGRENCLFTLENEKRLRVLNIKHDGGSAKEIQSASLSGSRHCSCIAWSRDDSLLALVVDRLSIYFWDIKRNRFSQFRPRTDVVSKTASNSGGITSILGAPPANRKTVQIQDIELIVWSKVSNKLAIFYANGQILICNIGIGATSSTGAAKGTEEDDQVAYQSIWERRIDKSESTLKRVVSIAVSDSCELFACFSETSEVVILTFDGISLLYFPCENIDMSNAKFSPLMHDYDSKRGHYKGQSLHLACQSSSEQGMYLKKIPLNRREKRHDLEPILYSDITCNLKKVNADNLLDFYWLDSGHLLLCLESGSIQLMNIIRSSIKKGNLVELTELFKIDASSSLFDSRLTTPVSSTSSRPASRNLGLQDRSIETNSISSEKLNSTDVSLPDAMKDEFKIFRLIRVTNKHSAFRQTFALAAATHYKLFYYEIYELENSKVKDQASELFSFEHFDDVDLSDSLQRVNLELERVEWNLDCSLISLQVTSGHLLIYKTRLQNSMVVSYGSRAAFLSSTDEVTILNYGTSSLATCDTYLMISTRCETTSQTSVDSRPSPTATRVSDNAILLSVHPKPSLIAIGPCHLALALNNRVRLYQLNESQLGTSPQDTTKTGATFQELDYLTIVTGISLSSHFVAVQFDDSRLKLHGIGAQNSAGSRELIDNERFFPDPSQPELITAFTLTEKLLVFCTNSRINIFCLSNWIMVQICYYSDVLNGHIRRLRPNERGNQFVCLICAESNFSSKMKNVALYDLHSNEIVSLMPPQEANLWPRLMQKQIYSTINMLTFDRSLTRNIVHQHELPTRELDQFEDSDVIDAIWDTDGRGLLVVGSKFYHVFAVLCHTLSSEGPICVYAASAKKPINHVTLYMSQGVISYLTGLGRVINSILETHDEELKSNKLETQIQGIKDSLSVPHTRRDQSANEHEAPIDSGVISEDQLNSKLTKTDFMAAHLRVTLLKVDYLRSILPIYPLTKCRDICKQIMEEDIFNVNLDYPLIGELVNEYKLINQLVFKLLAAWSLFTLNLNFAAVIYKKNELQVQANLIKDLLDDIKTRRMDSRSRVNRRLLSILGIENNVTNMS